MNTRRFLLSLAGLAPLTITSRPAFAADEAPPTRLAADLIWGTNGEKPADKELKAIAPDLEKRLRRIFKWKSYYAIERKEFTVSSAKPARVEMSKECRMEVAILAAGDEFEIQLFGKGQLVVKKRQRIVPGEAVVLGGDDKNDNAWFVVVALAKPGEPRK
jgi:hypothetical protein